MTISGNMNEFNLNPEANPERNNFYPRYNIGLRIPLGELVDIPKNVKIAKENHRIAELSLNQQKLTIRTEVLRRYHKYVSAKELLKIATESENDAYNSHVLIETQFKSGEVTVVQYTNTLRNYSNAL